VIGDIDDLVVAIAEDACRFLSLTHRDDVLECPLERSMPQLDLARRLLTSTTFRYRVISSNQPQAATGSA
jgi:hypothetical protein